MRFYNQAFNKNRGDGEENPILVPGQHEYVNPLPESKTDVDDQLNHILA